MISLIYTGVGSSSCLEKSYMHAKQVCLLEMEMNHHWMHMEHLNGFVTDELFHKVTFNAFIQRSFQLINHLWIYTMHTASFQY